MANYAIIEDGVCTNIIVADPSFALKVGAIELPEGFGIGDACVSGDWTKTIKTKCGEPTPEQRLAALETAMLEVMGNV